MKRFSMFVTLLALALTACAAQPAPTAAPVGSTITVSDALGRQLSLPDLPKRIVITGKALFMIADAAYLFPEAQERVIGLGNAGQGAVNFIKLIDPQYEEKATLADAGAEQILALQPDLVILKSSAAESLGAPLETLGVPVLYVDFETPEQYERDLASLGKIFGNEARAAEINHYYQAKIAALQQTVQDAPKPRVLMLYYNDKDGNVAFNVPPLDWIQTQMVQMAGGQPVWADANPGKGWTQVTLEQVAAWDADQIFIISYAKPAPEVVAALKTDPNWQAIRALQDDHVYAFASDLYSWDQPDPRWILGLSWLAGKLHPALFPTLDIAAESQAFYQTLYRLDRSFFEEHLLPSGQW